MTLLGGRKFREVWLADFEFSVPPGERPSVVCLVAWELTSGRKIKLWREDLLALGGPPYATDKDSLFVAYYASADLGCHLSRAWPLPENVLDLFTEFRCHTNGKSVPAGNGLVGALVYCGLDSISVAEKDEMRELVMRGGPWSPEEREAVLDYCESDVAALAKLLLKMDSVIDLPRALLRGRYMKAAAHIEYVGVPIDAHNLKRLRRSWELIQERLIEEIDAEYGVYEGRTFKKLRFAEWLAGPATSRSCRE